VAPERPRTGPVRLRLTLITEEGPLTGQKFSIEGEDVFLFGRDRDCHARITDDAFVSRHHFLIRIAPPDVLLRDLGSRNGTAVNGQWSGGRVRRRDGRIETRESGKDVQLHEGDEIRVGHTVFRVRVDIPPELATGVGGAATTTATVSTGRATIGPWTILQEIGHGSTGPTFLATNATGERVALKLFQGSNDEAGRGRFLRECELLRALEHPNIVRFVDAGHAENVAYLAMEYCDLGSARDLARTRGGRLPGRDARPLILQAARGLAHAHSCDLVHRDIKPENLLLKKGDDGPVVKIGDFGLAKVFTAVGISGVTMTGISGGTPGYMPREQLREFRRLRPASDVWSFAATIYELLTGHLPRAASSKTEPLLTVLEGVVIPIRERRPDIPESLAKVIDDALDTDPEKRPQDGAALLAALETAL
jgi:serine/threonine protein kinase